MSKYYLKFEEDIKILDEQIISIDNQSDLTDDEIILLNDLKNKRSKVIDKVYSGLSGSGSVFSLHDIQIGLTH